MRDARWRLSDLAWGAEAWALLRVTVPTGALPLAGQLCTVFRVTAIGQHLEGDAVSLERAGLSLPVLTPAAFGNLAGHEPVKRRLVELAAAAALMRVRQAAAANGSARVDTLLEAASRQFAGNEWLAAVLEAMRYIAAGRERVRAMKEMLYPSSQLRSRLTAKDESVAFCAAESVSVPAHLRRKPAQGKGDD